FPLAAKAAAWFLGAAEAALIGPRADHQDEIRLLDAVCAPPRPAFRWRGLVLIDPGIDAVCAQPVADRQDAVLVLRGVVAVAQEDLGRHLGGRAGSEIQGKIIQNLGPSRGGKSWRGRFVAGSASPPPLVPPHPPVVVEPDAQEEDEAAGDGE